MTENLVCDKCGHKFDNQLDLQKHKLNCTGKDSQQGRPDRPVTRGAGGQGSS